MTEFDDDSTLLSFLPFVRREGGGDGSGDVTFTLSDPIDGSSRSEAHRTGASAGGRGGSSEEQRCRYTWRGTAPALRRLSSRLPPPLVSAIDHPLLAACYGAQPLKHAPAAPADRATGYSRGGAAVSTDGTLSDPAFAGEGGQAGAMRSMASALLSGQYASVRNKGEMVLAMHCALPWYSMEAAVAVLKSRREQVSGVCCCCAQEGGEDRYEEVPSWRKAMRMPASLAAHSRAAESASTRRHLCPAQHHHHHHATLLPLRGLRKSC